MYRFSLNRPADDLPGKTRCTLALLEGEDVVAELPLTADQGRRLSLQLDAGEGAGAPLAQAKLRSAVLKRLVAYVDLNDEFEQGDLYFVEEGIKSRIDGHGVYIDAVEAAARWLEAQGDIYPLDIFDGIGARVLRWALARWPSEMRGALIHDGGPAPDHTLAEMFETGAAAVLDVLVARGYLTPAAADRIEFTHTHRREVMTLAVETSESGWSVSLVDPADDGEGEPC